ncbi:MAG: carboxyltransferase domain-containing protein, partial [Pseudomonadales bacterium]|nr:carboxyltransferase domain-containing protein [Pseudomonadales bacterium]
RLVTTKYNPARTWTAENSVGIGGAYLCIYGMEGPGGYQFVGRTLQMWNRYQKTDEFEVPWLLRFFDQIRFYEVSADELKQIRQDFPLGQYPLKIEQTTFNLNTYQDELKQQQPAIEAFQQQREQAFNEELRQWREQGQLTFEQDTHEDSSDTETLPVDVTGIESPVSGSVWQIKVNPGQQVKAGDTILVLESMKMEIEVYANTDGTIEKVLKEPGQPVTAGQTVVWMKA